MKANGQLYIPKEYMTRALEGKIQITDKNRLYLNAISNLTLDGSRLIIGTQRITYPKVLLDDKVEINNTFDIQKMIQPVIEILQEHIDAYNVYMLHTVFGHACKVAGSEEYPYPVHKYCSIKGYYLIKKVDLSDTEIDSIYIKSILSNSNAFV